MLVLKKFMDCDFNLNFQTNKTGKSLPSVKYKHAKILMRPKDLESLDHLAKAVVWQVIDMRPLQILEGQCLLYRTERLGFALTYFSFKVVEFGRMVVHLTVYSSARLFAKVLHTLQTLKSVKEKVYLKVLVSVFFKAFRCGLDGFESNHVRS